MNFPRSQSVAFLNKKTVLLFDIIIFKRIDQQHHVVWINQSSLWVGFIVMSRGLRLTPAWISSHMPSKVWDEITHPFANFNGANLEVWEWTNNFSSHYIVNVITCPWIKYDDIPYARYPNYWLHLKRCWPSNLTLQVQKIQDFHDCYFCTHR